MANPIHNPEEFGPEPFPLDDGPAMPGDPFALPPQVRSDAMPSPPEALRRQVARREFLRLERTKTAAETIGRLPEPGTDVVCLLARSFHGFDMLPAVLTLAGCAAEELHAATWAMSDAHGKALLRMLDAGHVRRVSLATGVFFERGRGAIHEILMHGLQARGQRYRAARVHAKVMALRLADGRRLAISGSANFTGNGNIEQMTLSRDDALYAWHVGWINALLDA